MVSGAIALALQAKYVQHHQINFRSICYYLNTKLNADNYRGQYYFMVYFTMNFSLISVAKSWRGETCNIWLQWVRITKWKLKKTIGSKMEPDSKVPSKLNRYRIKSLIKWSKWTYLWLSPLSGTNCFYFNICQLPVSVVSSSWGFGLLDACTLTEFAKHWTGVSEQLTCTMRYSGGVV